MQRSLTPKSRSRSREPLSCLPDLRIAGRATPASLAPPPALHLLSAWFNERALPGRACGRASVGS